ncbi:MAG: hypothetical protein WEA56_00600 [Balneolaceae bacterium]
MNKKLTISEKYSRYWPAIAIGSAVLALLFYIIYHYVSNVLFEGYLRLISFVFFALSILSFFKLRDGKIQIDIEQMDEKVFKISYQTGDRRLFSEEIQKDEISEMMIDEMPNRSLYNDLIKSDRCLKIKKKDVQNWVYLNSINGRVIPLSRENAYEMKIFIEQL